MSKPAADRPEPKPAPRPEPKPRPHVNCDLLRHRLASLKIEDEALKQGITDILLQISGCE